jgi:hypothetical protein
MIEKLKYTLGMPKASFGMRGLACLAAFYLASFG